MIGKIKEYFGRFFAVNMPMALFIVVMLFLLSCRWAYNLISTDPRYAHLRISAEQGILDVDSVMKIKKELEMRGLMELQQREQREPDTSEETKNH